MSGKQALLVIDVQTGMFTLPVPLYKGQDVLSNIVGLIEKARKRDVPIIYMQHCGKKGSLFEENTSGWQIHPAIRPQEHDIILQKKHSDSFYQTNLADVLQSRDINELVVCGIATEGCVDTTIRRAFSMNFSVIAVSDCHTTTDNKILTAGQVIEHHNKIFEIFSIVKTFCEIDFN